MSSLRIKVETSPAPTAELTLKIHLAVLVQFIQQTLPLLNGDLEKIVSKIRSNIKKPTDLPPILALLFLWFKNGNQTDSLIDPEDLDKVNTVNQFKSNSNLLVISTGFYDFDFFGGDPFSLKNRYMLQTLSIIVAKVLMSVPKFEIDIVEAIKEKIARKIPIPHITNEIFVEFDNTPNLSTTTTTTTTTSHEQVQDLQTEEKERVD